MPKLDFEFELTGLKLKIKGESDDVTGKVADLQRQVQGLMNTIGALAQQSGSLPPPPPANNGSGAKFIDAATDAATDVTPTSAARKDFMAVCQQNVGIERIAPVKRAIFRAAASAQRATP
jgi:hypothetical protein